MQHLLVSYCYFKYWLRVPLWRSVLCAGVNVLGFVEGVVVDCDIVEGGGLSHNNHLMDIYSNSWGPVDTGYYAQGPGTLAQMALEMGVKEVGLSLTLSKTAS